MLRSLFRRLPSSVQRGLRATRDRVVSAQGESRLRDGTELVDTPPSHDELPRIAGYWSDRYIRPLFERFGYSSPDDFFAKQLSARAAARAPGAARFLSVGAGGCDSEVMFAKALLAAGHDAFTIDCVHFDPGALARGRTRAADAGVAAHIRTIAGDPDAHALEGRYDAIVANFSLHNVVDLERLCGVLHAALADDGVLLVAGMIGRNGHQRWPEARAIVEEYWRELPESYRWNVQLQRQEHEFHDWDCAQGGVEGVRAQDVLPLLRERFGFEQFLAFSNAIDPFVDRSFGPHFDPALERDRAFIDKVQARDEHEILIGRIKPTHMIGVLRRDRTVATKSWRHLTPEFCVRDPAHAPVPLAAIPSDTTTGLRRDACFPAGHFYSPVVDTVEADARSAQLWPEHPQTPGIDYDDASHRTILAEWFPRFMPAFDYPELLEETAELDRFYVRNSQYSWLDCRALFVLLQAWRPRRLLEVGSGFSTLLAADVNRRFLGGSCEITCIEPYPRPFLARGIAGVHELVQQCAQDVPMARYTSLQAGDVLFIDSSHVAKTGSDVNFLLLDVLPRLAPGVRVHIHDVFLPYEYPRAWVIDDNRSWNEQYIVRALLTHSRAWRVVFGSSYAAGALQPLVAAALAHPKGHVLGGGSLWLERLPE